jgi:hypothetical protein
MVQICRNLNSLAFNRQVWLALLRGLDAPLFLDRLSESPLHKFSAAELIGLAKRIVQGPQTWSLSHSAGPLIARQKVLHPKICTGPGFLSWTNDTKLLPAGQYVLFNNWKTLECRNVAEDQPIWKYQSQWGYANVMEFAAEVVDDGLVAIILIGLRTGGNRALQKKCV